MQVNNRGNGFTATEQQELLLTSGRDLDLHLQIKVQDDAGEALSDAEYDELSELLQERMASLAEQVANSEPQRFKDVPNGHWAETAIIHATQAGLMKLFPDGTFRGNEKFTRYQAALLISGVLGLLKQNQKVGATGPMGPVGPVGPVGPKGERGYSPETTWLEERLGRIEHKLGF